MRVIGEIVNLHRAVPVLTVSDVRAAVTS